MATQRMTMPHSEETCTTPLCECSCKALPRERARFFTGRFLTARDLRDEQLYVLSRLRLRNRLFHGWGVVCGLEVEPHGRPECRDRWVVVKPGIAIDCCGREIFICRDSPVCLPGPLKPTRPESEPEKPDYRDNGYEREEYDEPEIDHGGDPSQEYPKRRDPRQEPPKPEPCPPDKPEAPKWGPYVVCLRYVECPIEPGPVLVDEGCCKPGTQSFNRVREGFQLEVVALEELGEDCWPGRRRNSDDQNPCPCGDAGGVDCFEPSCPCGHCVPLALLHWHPRRSEVVIDMLDRPRVRSTHEALTRVVDINWPHGGSLSVRQLHQHKDRLEITFSRPLRRPEDLPPGVGIRENTFVVTYSYGSQKDAEFLPYARTPYLDESGCKAIFEIDPDYVGGQNSIERALVHVALKGDFLPDLNGNPIDANHLNGLRPSGNGVAGGTFESWFRVGGDYRNREESSR